MDAYQILVIVLSVAFGILLIISGVFLFLLIKVLKQVKRITEKADHVMDGVESVSEVLKKSAGPLAISRVLTGFFTAVKKRKNRGGS